MGMASVFSFSIVNSRRTLYKQQQQQQVSKLACHFSHKYRKRRGEKIEDIEKTMAMRSLFVVALVLAGAAAPVTPRGADGSGAGAGGSECGSTRLDHLALKLAPCASAVEDPEAAPSGSCCAAVRDVARRHSPECLCALLLSDVVKHSGVDLEAVITIPKRCNLAGRPVGYKCGEYTLPGLHE